MNDDHPFLISTAVQFFSQNQKIAGLLFLPNSGDCVPVVLFCHGVFGFKEAYVEFCEFLAKRNVASLALDMHGHGESEGDPFSFHPADWIADIRAALDFLEKHPRIDSSRIAGFGLSSGGTAILETALIEPRLKAIVLLSASVQNNCNILETQGIQILKWIGRIHKRIRGKSLGVPSLKILDKIECLSDPELSAIWRTHPYVRAAFASLPFPGTSESILIDTIKRVEGISVPTLVLHGTEDKIEPPHKAQHLYYALTCEKDFHFIPSNGHFGHFDRNRQRVFRLTLQWIRDKFSNHERPRAHLPDLRRDLKAHGRGCLAYSTLQPGMRYFVKPDVGYIAYYDFFHPVLAPKGKRYVLSDPVCHKNQYSSILEDFLKDLKPTIFVQIHQDFADILARYIPEINRIGIETEIPLQEFNLNGKSKSQLRQWIHKAAREEVEVIETPIKKMNPQEVAGVSREWLRQKGKRHLGFMARPLLLQAEEDVRYFWARQNNHLIGMVVFDPMYEDGKIVGYYQNLVRYSKKAPHGTTDLITTHAMECFKREGAQVISLGLSPFCKIEDTEFNYNKISAWMMKMTYLHIHKLYNFQGNASHKRKYGGIEKKVYYGGTYGNKPVELLIGLKAVRVI